MARKAHPYTAPEIKLPVRFEKIAPSGARRNAENVGENRGGYSLPSTVSKYCPSVTNRSAESAYSTASSIDRSEALSGAAIQTRAAARTAVRVTMKRATPDSSLLISSRIAATMHEIQAPTKTRHGILRGSNIAEYWDKEYSSSRQPKSWDFGISEFGWQDLYHL
jgi:hypothetical protein